MDRELITKTEDFLKQKFVEVTMDYRKINPSEVNALWDLQKQYKAEIGEDEPSDDGKERLADAIDKGMISFYGVLNNNTLIGCCSITVGFSIFFSFKWGI